MADPGIACRESGGQGWLHRQSQLQQYVSGQVSPPLIGYIRADPEDRAGLVTVVAVHPEGIWLVVKDYSPRKPVKNPKQSKR